MTRKKHYTVWLVGFLVLGMALLCPERAEAAERKTIYNSPYVQFSPDQKAFTTCAGDQDYEWYAVNENNTVYSGIESTLREPGAGEHYYSARRYGEIPVGAWRVVHRTGQCIHGGYPKKGWHGISYNTQKCMKNYYSGWRAFCADCGEVLEQANIYMSRDAAASIQYLDLGSEEEPMSYYYLCPFCRNMEQGVGFPAHRCKAVSWNQYKVIYHPNTESYNGYMEESRHMYNNATEYEGRSLIPANHLTENSYTRPGYLFTGWNTEPDGSGIAYEDKAEILNLSSADWNDRTTWEEEDNGTVILYAQWCRSKSTLLLDAAGGTYDGLEKYSLTEPFLTRYKIRTERIQAPKGCTVYFETNGGRKTAPIVGTMHFVEWMQLQPFQGKMEGDTYLFRAPDGNVDTLKAVYEADAVVLPKTYRPGWSFGGWYYDAQYTAPAGGAGDRIVPAEDVTLYAQWVDLRLRGLDNYRDNDGKGAVDLSWSQTDANNKTYLIYQKKENGPWIRVNSAGDIDSTVTIKQNDIFTGTTQQYRIPYTGLYTINALGAQGESYGSYVGGYGGSVSGTFWLKKGEVLSYTVGGRNGYNGGGEGSVFGNGGGMTSVLSDQKGILLIAGGGGGASPAGAGGAGGSMASVVRRSEGEAGMAGGGAGYFGGTAGEKIIHHHTDDCYRDVSYTPTFGDWDYFMWGTNCYDGGNITSTQYNGHTHDYDDDEDAAHIVRVGWSRNSNYPPEKIWDVSGYRGIPTNGNSRLHLSIFSESWGETSGVDPRRSKYCILDQNGDKVAEGAFSDFPYNDTIRSGDGVIIADFSENLNLRLPEGTTHIFVHLFFYLKESDAWTTSGISALRFSGGRILTCGYQEGQAVSSHPAYGGSNYVNPEYALTYASDSGVRSGDGMISLQSEAIGYQDTLQLDGVAAPDHAAPDSIAGEILREALDGRRIRVTWTEPEDRGTAYYHKAESYLTGSTSLLCASNIIKNTLISGVKGYYYIVDQKASTVVTGNAENIKNIKYVQAPSAEITTTDAVQYLHVAAVDVAGNVGKTTHFRIEESDVLWKMRTKQLTVDDTAGNVYPAGDKSWYVRADGKTPFTLRNVSYMEGVARRDYQPNETIYETVLTDGRTARNRIYTPSVEITDGTVRTDASGLGYSTEGATVLQQYPYSYTVRSGRNRELTGVQKFVIDRAMTGQSIQVIPVAGADRGKDKVYSVRTEDERNKITLIPDGEEPVIHGMEILQDRDLIDRRDGNVTIRATAVDGVSGIREFHIVIRNTDNAISQTYTPGADGCITITITKDDPIFSGDFTVLGYAVDNVGNECSIVYGTTEFALESSVERMLEPREPVFKCGESGILTFTTWGYADRVEVIFPESMTALDPTLNRTYDYTDTPGYKITEQLPFMVPLYTPENQELEITVRVYKGDKKLEDHPTISVIGVSGTVLDELRTRLR